MLHDALKKCTFALVKNTHTHTQMQTASLF